MKSTGYELLTDKEGLNLREYQVKSHFIDLSGGKNPAQFIEVLKSIDKAKEQIFNNNACLNC